MKTIALSAIALLVSAVASASPATSHDFDAVPQGNNWGCNSEQGSNEVTACRAECKSTYEAERTECQATFQTCSQACSDAQCRATCRDAKQACLAPLRGEMDRCAQACVLETEGCRYL